MGFVRALANGKFPNWPLAISCALDNTQGNLISQDACFPWVY